MGHGLTIRGDSYYCPLSLSLDSYWNCVNDCWHCYLRRLNRTWGQDLRPTNVSELEKKLINGLKNKNPKSSLAHALKNKNTIRFGNKTDPFQPPERKHRISRDIMLVLQKLQWTYVVETMCTGVMLDYEEILLNSVDLVTVMAIVSPGYIEDWEILERKRTTHPEKRLDHIQYLKEQYNISVGVNGEPFIPGYHTIKQFEDIIKNIKSRGINRYNTYNFHFNEFIAKRFADIGIDPLPIGIANEDKNWRPIQQKLIEIAEKHNVILGCPDFVNSGKNYFQNCNTCCGIEVKNPTTWNTHSWKRMLQTGHTIEETIEETWDGIGDYDYGIKILSGKAEDVYTMADAGFVKKKKKEDGFGLI